MHPPLKSLFYKVSEKKRAKTYGGPRFYRSSARYTMYDTMPADEPGWKADPFAGEILRVEPFVETLVARGARDPGS